MQNTGTWNSDLVLLFVFLFFLPIFITMLVNVFRSDAFSESLSHCQDVSPDVVGLDFAAEENKAEMVAMQAELKLVKEQLSKLQTKKNKSEEGEKKKKTTPEWTDLGHFAEAVEALRSLGLKKAEASSLVQDLCSRKKFTSSEELIKEAILCI